MTAPPRWRRVDLRLVLFILRVCRDAMVFLLGFKIFSLSIKMGICWSEPPVRQVPVVASYGQQCKRCGIWNANDYCEKCLQQNAMSYIAPSAPPMQPQPQYTYAVMPQQQQQMYAYYQRPYVVAQPQPQPQQQQMGVGTAIVGGFVMGAIMDDILDPMD